MKAQINLKQLRELVPDIKRALQSLVDAGTRRGVELVRQEAPGGSGGTIGRGVSPQFSFRSYPFEGRIVVDARVRSRGGAATLHLPGGGTRQISLRASSRSFDVGLAVAEGTGIYGPRGEMIEPKRARVLLIEVDETPSSESYVEAAGRKFILRPRSRGMRPNDYPGRAADRLAAEIETLADAALERGGV
jgi:hypothetical protein